MQHVSFRQSLGKETFNISIKQHHGQFGVMEKRGYYSCQEDFCLNEGKATCFKLLEV